jgi:hypothetical protein
MTATREGKVLSEENETLLVSAIKALKKLAAQISEEDQPDSPTQPNVRSLPSGRSVQVDRRGAEIRG